MACRDEGQSAQTLVVERERLDRATRVACEAMTLLEGAFIAQDGGGHRMAVFELSKDAQLWWTEHKAADEARRRREAEQAAWERRQAERERAEWEAKARAAGWTPPHGGGG